MCYKFVVIYRLLPFIPFLIVASAITPKLVTQADWSPAASTGTQSSGSGQKAGKRIPLSDNLVAAEMNLKFVPPVLFNEPDSRSIKGRIFSRWIRLAGATFKNSEDADFFEATVGVIQGTDTNGKYRFIVRCEDDTLFTSSWMSKADPPVIVSVSTKGRQSVTLITEKSGEFTGYDDAIWGNPDFVKQAGGVPVLVLPLEGKVITKSTDLVWSDVDSIDEYLLEVQCYVVSDVSQAKDPGRFQVISVDKDTTSWKFDASKMPQGKYRWRVHSLGGKGFAGEASAWRTFVFKKS